jgi:hypothetical protein
MLGIKVAESTVGKYMVRTRRAPSQGWKTFLRNHAAGLASIARTQELLYDDDAWSHASGAQSQHCASSKLDPASGEGKGSSVIGEP